MSNGIPKNQIKTQNTINQAEHEDGADAKRVLPVNPDGSISKNNTDLIKLGTNLLAILTNTDIDSSQFLVTNDNFFIYDNDGDFVKEG